MTFTITSIRRTILFDALEAGDSVVTLTIDAEGNPCVHYPGDYNVAVPGHRDIDYRQGVLEREGVDTQIITFTTPGTHVEPPDRAVRFEEACVNDAFAEDRQGALFAAASPRRWRRCHSATRRLR